MSNAQRDIRRKQQGREHTTQSGNVRKTCRHLGIPRSLFDVWRRACQRDGEAGLVNRRPIARSHPKTTRPEIVDQVLHRRRTYHLEPIWIGWYLARYYGVSISAATVYRIRCRQTGASGPFRRASDPDALSPRSTCYGRPSRETPRPLQRASEIKRTRQLRSIPAQPLLRLLGLAAKALDGKPELY